MVLHLLNPLDAQSLSWIPPQETSDKVVHRVGQQAGPRNDQSHSVHCVDFATKKKKEKELGLFCLSQAWLFNARLSCFLVSFIDMFFLNKNQV